MRLKYTDLKWTSRRSPSAILLLLLNLLSFYCFGQVSYASNSGFAWINTEQVNDYSFGNGYSIYSAAWPAFKQYPGAWEMQMGLAGCWLTTQRTGNEPEQFYTTIEGGMGWWHDTRFGRKAPKFIMGGVSNNFYAWANGPGAGRSDMLGSGQRDWSTPGGKYGIAQLSNKLIWAPDGLNLSQSVDGELFGYGYQTLPLSDPIENTAGTDIKTGNQYWTLFLNTTNFKGPATVFLPTFWTEPVLEDPSIDGLFLDSRPSDPNITFGIEHAISPAISSLDENGTRYAKIQPMQFPRNYENSSLILNEVSVYSKDAVWNKMENWFQGGAKVETTSLQEKNKPLSFINDGGDLIGIISGEGFDFTIDLDYIKNTQYSSSNMGFEFDNDVVTEVDGYFTIPEYFKLDGDQKWQNIPESEVPESTNLRESSVVNSGRPEIAYLTPMDPECAWQDPDGPWRSPGPVAGPFKSELGDGSTLTYYWYRFVDQPSIVNANLPDHIREQLQIRVEKIHEHWKHTDEYFADPSLGNLAALDPGVIVTPPTGLEVGYVPIVTRQEKSEEKLRIFILAGQSNMEGYGRIDNPENNTNSLIDVLAKDTSKVWPALGEIGNWKTLDNAYLYFARPNDTIRGKVGVGQGASSNFIGSELMFAQELDNYYEDPVLIIKTAWGGKSLAEDFRPPSSEGETGEYYNKIIETVKNVTSNLESEFPEIDASRYEISGFAWFQGWNDGASDTFLNEYESNMSNLVNDIRSDLELPSLPVVIVNSGHGGFDLSGDLWVRSMQEVVSVAQENVACNDDVYGGRVGFVNSKPFYLSSFASPSSSIHHFNDNALTYLNIGKSMGLEMIRAINDMAYCYSDCGAQLIPGIVSVGNRVWNDLNRNGISEANEPGIPGVTLVIWADSDGDGVPDWQGFGGTTKTDENGYYRFGGLLPGNYVVFVWSLDNWDVGDPLHGFVSTSNFVADPNNDVDNDNNAFGQPFTDIFSGIITLTTDGEPLNDGDPFNCYFDYDAGGNNSLDFGFYDPNVSSIEEGELESQSLIVLPNPVSDVLTIQSTANFEHMEIVDAIGNRITRLVGNQNSIDVDVSEFPAGIYFVRIIDGENSLLGVEKFIKN